MEYIAPIYPKVPFTYKFIVKGKMPKETIDAYCDLSISTYKKLWVTVLVRAQFYEPMPVKWKAQVQVSYSYYDPEYLKELDKLIL